MGNLPRLSAAIHFCVVADDSWVLTEPYGDLLFHTFDVGWIRVRYFLYNFFEENVSNLFMWYLYNVIIFFSYYLH